LWKIVLRYVEVKKVLNSDESASLERSEEISMLAKVGRRRSNGRDTRHNELRGSSHITHEVIMTEELHRPRSWYHRKQRTVILTWPNSGTNGARSYPDLSRSRGTKDTRDSGSCSFKVVPCKVMTVEGSATWSHCDVVVDSGHISWPAYTASTFARLYLYTPERQREQLSTC
jgi:hypothetical protein